MMFRFVAGTCLSMVMAFGLVFAQNQTQSQSQSQTPKPPSQPPPAVNSTPPVPSGVGEAVDPNKYSIGAEDVLAIQVWREPDFTRVLAVRPDGKITMPLIGDLQAAGLTPIQLTKDLTEKLSQLVNHPDVTIIVEQVRSKKYYIDGGVNRSGEYPLITPTKILEALSKTGGFTEFADRKHITILRGNRTFRFNYLEVIRGKKMEQNIFLENGDHIIVKQ